jgi:hypothetical protein
MQSASSALCTHSLNRAAAIGSPQLGRAVGVGASGHPSSANPTAAVSSDTDTIESPFASIARQVSIDLRPKAMATPDIISATVRAEETRRGVFEAPMPFFQRGPRPASRARRS